MFAQGEADLTRGPSSPDSNQTETTTLDQVPHASRVEVVEVAGGRSAIRQLAQLNIRAGETLEVERIAPLGGPILVETRGSTIALARSLAHKVKVRVLE